VRVVNWRAVDCPAILSPAAAAAGHSDHKPTPILRLLAQFFAHWIHQDITGFLFQFVMVTQAVIEKITDQTLGLRADCYLGDHRLLAAANFEFVAIGVLEKEGVVTRAVALTKFRPLEVFPASFAHELRNPIHFLTRIGPKRDTRAIRFMVFIWTKTKEFRRFIAACGIKSMDVSPGFFVSKSKLRQQLSVKLSCYFHVCHPQIDMIEATCFHFVILNRIAAQFNRS
jgi:hypothetical protein